MLEHLFKRLQKKTMEEDVMPEITEEILLKEYDEMVLDEAFVQHHINEVTPPGWEGTVKAMKKYKRIHTP